MTPVISVEHLSKRYDLGVIGTGSLAVDLERWWARLRKQPDPYSIIGEEDQFSQNGLSILALDDVSFTVQQGEALGIIGRNGAGKSTLLKILSRVTAPTSGVVKVKGRIGSLLEVGTGFHPELTGRENVFLNGAILGMRKEEVVRKFDEIVDFSGVEKFIDTPVKRYSSGMYVRLAFAVAAHLDPEILVVDEVLAVGDAEFQKKCLGKMGDVTGEGRTVLFVSHNMQAIQNLCDRTIFFDAGAISYDGISTDAISAYLKSTKNMKTGVSFHSGDAPGNENIRLLKASIIKQTSQDSDSFFTTKDPLEINIEFINNFPGETAINLSLYLQDENNILVFTTNSGRRGLQSFKKGVHIATCIIPGNLLNQGTYTISKLMFIKDGNTIIYEHPDLLTFEILAPSEKQYGYIGKKRGVIRPDLDWFIKPA